MIRQFMQTRIKKNCAWYAIPMSIIFTWRFTHTRQIPFFSTTASKIYCLFLICTYLVLMLIFFLLFMFASNKKD